MTVRVSAHFRRDARVLFQVQLFRKKAIDHVRQRLWGEILIIRPPSVGLVAFVASFAFLLIGAYLYFGTYAQKVSGVGQLVPTRGVAKIFAPRAGSLAQVFVREGDSVKPGQRLFAIEVKRTTEGGEAVDYALIEATKTKIDLIDARRGNEKVKLDTAQSRLRGELTRNRRALAQIDNQIAVQEQIIDSVEGIIEESQDLVAKGYIAKIEFNARQERLLNHIQHRATLRRQKIELENDIERFANDVSDLQVAYRATELLLNRERLSLNERLITLESERFTFVNAPVAGVATGLQAIEGSSVSGRIPLLSIVPEDETLLAHLYVPASAIGFVEKGQRVQLKFEAYDYRKFGAYRGSVLDITDVLFTPAEVAHELVIQEPSYRVIIQPEKPAVRAYGRVIDLRPDMRLSADVMLASRRLYQWLADPFTRFQRAS